MCGVAIGRGKAAAMFCPECGHPLESPDIKFCPNCGNRVIPPAAPEPAGIPPLNASEAASETAGERITYSKLCTAALLLGAGAFVCAVLTLICRMLSVHLRVLGAVATGAFFLAPLACCFGVAGIVVRARNRNMRGLPSAIIGLLLGLLCGAGASYLLLSRMLGL